jgi:hypothetical protein
MEWAVVMMRSPDPTTKPDASKVPAGTSPTTQTVDAIRRSTEGFSKAAAAVANIPEAAANAAHL